MGCQIPEDIRKSHERILREHFESEAELARIFQKKGAGMLRRICGELRRGNRSAEALIKRIAAGKGTLANKKLAARGIETLLEQHVLTFDRNWNLKLAASFSRGSKHLSTSLAAPPA